jgi:hypothetical protein
MVDQPDARAPRPRSEWSERIDTEPLQQGDVFAWNGAVDDPWRRFGVIVTADCDMAHNKHRQIISYCPIISVTDFLVMFWIPEDLSRALNKLIVRVCDRLTAQRRMNKPHFDLPVEPDVLNGWLQRRGPDGVADDVGAQPGPTRESLINELTLIHSLLIREPIGRNARADLEVLARAKLNQPAPTPADLTSQMRRMWSEYKNRFQSLPGDLFFLNELGADHCGGYLVYLRRVADLGPDAIATRRTQGPSCY